MGNRPAAPPAQPFLGPARPDYNGVHYHLRLAFGAAKFYRCLECGGPAEQWSYDNADPFERMEGIARYSANLVHYVPLCRSCHRKTDDTRRTNEGWWS